MPAAARPGRRACASARARPDAQGGLFLGHACRSTWRRDDGARHADRRAMDGHAPNSSPTRWRWPTGRLHVDVGFQAVVSRDLSRIAGLLALAPVSFELFTADVPEAFLFRNFDAVAEALQAFRPCRHADRHFAGRSVDPDRQPMSATRRGPSPPFSTAGRRWPKPAALRAPCLPPPRPARASMSGRSIRNSASRPGAGCATWRMPASRPRRRTCSSPPTTTRRKAPG